MFQDFAKKKFDDYLALLEFPAGRISFGQVRTSTLPPFIITFFEHYVTNKSIPLNKNEFEDILNKAIIFNINYIIRPKNTIHKFLFGEVETRPVHFVRERLKYFQFYGYYVSQIEDFIAINGLEVVSSAHVDHLVSEINKRLLEEISQPGAEQQRMNLVKLLYYFFHDLGTNNPINIKIPQKILSVYFSDKGYYDIKKRVDNFFSGEIFIQEAMEMMDPETRRSQPPASEIDVSDDKMKEIITQAKRTKQREAAEKEVAEIIRQEQKEEEFRSIETTPQEIEKEELPVDEIRLEEHSAIKEEPITEITAEEESLAEIKSEEKPVAEIKQEEESAPEIKKEEQPLFDDNLEMPVRLSELTTEAGSDNFITSAEVNEDVEKMLRAQEEMPVFVPVGSTEELHKQAVELRKKEKLEQDKGQFIPMVKPATEQTTLPIAETPVETKSVEGDTNSGEQENKHAMKDITIDRAVINEDIYSDDLIFASQFNDMAPPKQVSEKDKRRNLINDLFCEPSYKKKIIKNIFKKDEDSFYSTVSSIIDKDSWGEAVEIIDTQFKKSKVKLYAPESLRFVDVLQEYFEKIKSAY